MSWSRKQRVLAERTVSPQKRSAGFSRKRLQRDFRWDSGGPDQGGMRTRKRFAASALLTRGEDARQNAVKLFDRQILADVTVSSGTQGSVHPLFVVSHAGKNDNWHVLTHLP